MDAALGLIAIIVVALAALGLWVAIHAADADIRDWESRHPRPRPGNWTGDE